MSGPDELASFTPGEILDDKYRVERMLGRGGMGVVVEATHLELQDRVAIKILRGDQLDDDARARFIREARAAARLKSENIMRVVDVGTLDSGVPYMVMELLQGGDLATHLATHGKLAAPQAVDLVLQACFGLAEAHTQGFVHRDIKPTNLFVAETPDGTKVVKLLDFGISKLSDDVTLTSTRAVLGTPAYMAPEQWRSAKDADARSDLWSIGAVLYELVEGVRPFDAETVTEMCAQVMSDDPRPMQVATGGLGKVIARCLEKEPEARFQSISELGRALIPFSADRPEAEELIERIDRLVARRADGRTPAPLTTPPALEQTGVATTPGAPRRAKPDADPKLDDSQPGKNPWFGGHAETAEAEAADDAPAKNPWFGANKQAPGEHEEPAPAAEEGPAKNPWFGAKKDREAKPGAARKGEGESKPAVAAKSESESKPGVAAKAESDRESKPAVAPKGESDRESKPAIAGNREAEAKPGVAGKAGSDRESKPAIAGHGVAEAKPAVAGKGESDRESKPAVAAKSESESKPGVAAKAGSDRESKPADAGKGKLDRESKPGVAAKGGSGRDGESDRESKPAVAAKGESKPAATKAESDRDGGSKPVGAGNGGSDRDGESKAFAAKDESVGGSKAAIALPPDPPAAWRPYAVVAGVLVAGAAIAFAISHARRGGAPAVPAGSAVVPAGSAVVPKAAVGGPVRGGTLRVATFRIDEPLIALYSNSPTRSQHAMHLAVETLLVLTPTGDRAPSVLADAQPRHDGMELVLTLRDGVMFHPGPCGGRAATGEDVKFSIEVARERKQIDLPFTRIEVAGNDVILALAHPAPLFSYSLERVRLVPAGIKTCEPDLQKMRHPIGTGPFQLVDAPNPDTVALEAAKGYWQQDERGEPLPYLDRVELVSVKDPSAVLSAMHDAPRAPGAIHMFAPDEATRAKLIDHTGKPHLIDTAKDLLLGTRTNEGQLGMWLLEVSRKAGPLHDPNIRRAIALAIDRAAVLDEAGKSASSPVAPAGRYLTSGVLGYDPSIKEYATDLVAARKALADAKHPDGKDLPELVFAYSHSKHGVDAVIAALAKIGIRARADDIGTELQARMGDEKPYYDALFVSRWLELHAGELIEIGEFDRYRIGETTPLLEKLGAKYKGDREPLYTQIEKQLMATLPTIPIARLDPSRVTYATIVTADVFGFQDRRTGYLAPENALRYTDVWLADRQ